MSERSLNAKLALDNSAFQEAYETLEQNLMAEWKHTPPEAWKHRERLYEKLQALNDIKAQLENFLHTAAMETTATGTAWTHRKV